MAASQAVEFGKARQDALSQGCYEEADARRFKLPHEGNVLFRKLRLVDCNNHS
jgi:hypothetical protein